MHSQVLEGRWSWTQSPAKPTEHLSSEQIAHLSLSKSNAFKPCKASRPANIHVELMHTGAIPDPFLRKNENQAQWVGETAWIYKCEFEANDVQESHLDLVFEGLDTFCTLYLDGDEILDCDNMFVGHRIPIELKSEKEMHHTLLFHFRSAFLIGKQLEAKHGKLVLYNGDSSRLYVRKAGYHYGWDWGPTLMTCGPFRPVTLECYTSRIEDFHVQSEVSAELSAKCTISFEVQGDLQEGQHYSVLVKSQSGKIVFQHKGEAAQVNKKAFDLSAEEVELWWPIRMGKQHQYTAEVTLINNAGKTLHSATKRFGIRRALLIQRPLQGEEGTSFFFEINNVPVFAGGSNFIPSHSFNTEADERDIKWVEMLAHGGQNMIRIWGGGLYLHSQFYERCSELGVMVWHDFMFACGQYPAHPSYLESVKQEAIYNVKRIRQPCLVLWTGNNEDYQIMQNFKLDWNPSDTTGPWSGTNVANREIYEKLLPSVVEQYAPGIPYTFGSPWDRFDSYCVTEGDTHQWAVWHGGHPYQEWDKLATRFCSEWGMQAFPASQTMDYMLDGDTSERAPFSSTVGFHNKADLGEKRLHGYIERNFRYAEDLDSYSFITQLMQADCCGSAYRVFRRNFKGPGREYTSGSLVWQLNDCWPVISWSIADFFFRPKAAFFSIKRSLAPITVGIKRYNKKDYFFRPGAALASTSNALSLPAPSYLPIPTALLSYIIRTLVPLHGSLSRFFSRPALNGLSTVFSKIHRAYTSLSARFSHSVEQTFSAALYEESSHVEIWACSSKLSTQEVTLLVEAYDLSTGLIVYSKNQDVTLNANSSTELLKTSVPALKSKEKTVVFCARLVERDGKGTLSRFTDWPEPFKYLTSPKHEDVGLTCNVDEEKGEVTVESKMPVKGLWLSFEGLPDLLFDDNGIDVVPNDPQVIRVKDLPKGPQLVTRYYGDSRWPGA